MSEINGDAEERDLQLAQVLDEYVAQLRAGTAPVPAELLAQHPELAEDLEACLACLDLIQQAGPGERSREPTALGDFRILREIGRGGMGVVYEAEQLSLHRRVALKVLSFAAALDSRHLQRFKNEALAAASLHHTNIVPVYAVGCERGVHFYAMQFIDGQSLAEMIAQLRRDRDEASKRQPVAKPDSAQRADTAPAALTTAHSAGDGSFYRGVARLGVQAAEALDHAHQQGVIHRDVKPANLLLDAAGHLWVADFGLARYQAGPGMTATGGVVGTVRYMSPEQALAKRALVDHRSDVYALGTTLYELLTLQPAYPGSDREEVLRQIAEGQPLPPRRIQPAIPVELETIVLKAMAREPEGRYQTALELADDLRRFLEGRPILARRPSFAERTVRWARRHRKALAAALAVLALGLVGLLTSTLVFWNEKEQTKAAQKRAEDNEAEALRQKQRAEANFTAALRGATDILMQLDAGPGGQPQIDRRLHDKLIEQGLRFFEGFIDEKNPDPAVRFQASQAYEQMARVYMSQHDLANGQAMMEKDFALLAKLMSEFPERDLYRRELIRARYLLGLFYKSLGQPRQAREEYLRTVQLCRQTAGLDVSAETMNTCAWILVDCPDETLRDADLATTLAERAVAREPANAKYWNTLGVAHYRRGAWAKARSALETSMERTAGGSPYDWFFLALSFHRLGDSKEAHKWHDKAVRWMKDHENRAEDLERYRTEADSLIGPP